MKYSPWCMFLIDLKVFCCLQLRYTWDSLMVFSISKFFFVLRACQIETGNDAANELTSSVLSGIDHSPSLNQDVLHSCPLNKPIFQSRCQWYDLLSYLVPSHEGEAAGCPHGSMTCLCGAKEKINNAIDALFFSVGVIRSWDKSTSSQVELSSLTSVAPRIAVCVSGMPHC